MYKPMPKEIFHVHTRRCKHAGEEQDYEYVEKAIDLGASRIVFTDHCPFPGNPFRSRMEIEELPEYILSMKQLKKEYDSKIEVLAGLEVEYFPSFENYYKELKDSGEFDLLMMGQHMFEHEDGTWSFMDEEKSDEYVGLCKAMVEGVRTGLFDVIAHPDRAFRWNTVWNSDTMRVGRTVISEAIKHGIWLEKNYSSMQQKYQYWEEFWNKDTRKHQLYGYDAHSVAEMESIWKSRRVKKWEEKKV